MYGTLARNVLGCRLRLALRVVEVSAPAEAERLEALL
jgi:hypothetical protein